MQLRLMELEKMLAGLNGLNSSAQVSPSDQRVETGPKPTGVALSATSFVTYLNLPRLKEFWRWSQFESAFEMTSAGMTETDKCSHLLSEVASVNPGVLEDLKQRGGS